MNINAAAASGTTVNGGASHANSINVVDGFIVHPQVVDKRIFQLEHGPMTKVDAIVLHQTDSKKLSLEHARAEGIGAHFYIDKDGTIYQTARLDQQVYSVGKIRSKCDDARTCSTADKSAISKIMSGNGTFGAKTSKLNAHELAKAYPDRYPTNGDSIAIEVVGKYDPATKLFERPTDKQTESLKWLCAELSREFGLDLSKDVYRHSDISYKQLDEAKSLIYK